MLHLALLALALLLQSPTGPPSSLEGQIVALGTNGPVPHARIVVAKVGGTVEDYRTGVADAAGRFTFRDLTPGSYRVYAEQQGYLRGEYGRRAANVAGTAVQIVEGPPTRITVTMIPTGVITGRVHDGGRPLPNVLVRAMRASFFDGQRSLVGADTAITDDLGEYRLFGLAPGIYFVSAVPQDRPRIEGDTYVVPMIPSIANGNRNVMRTAGPEALAKDLVEPAALDTGLFVPLFYPSTIDLTAAVAVDVQPGRTVPGIDLTIARLQTVRVRGRVIDATTGQPAQNVSVSVAQPEGRTFNITGGTVDASGAFELPAVPPGRHDLVARTTTQNLRLFGTTSIEVRDRSVENADLVVRPGTTLKGRASVIGVPAGVTPPRISVQLMGVGGMPGYSAMQLAPDGTFTVENVEAREYRVRIVRPGGFLAPAAARFGADDVTGRTFRFGPDMADIPLELVVNLAAGGLDLTVVDGIQRPVPGLTVTLVPDQPRRNQSSLYRTATTDTLGRTRLDDVIAGDYKLFTDEIDPSTWQDPDVILRYENGGTRVRIVEGARQNVTLRVPR